jgi:Holliday junction DNA helicase RuvA
VIVFLKGTLTAIESDRVWIEVHGVGYQVLLPANALAGLPPLGEEILLYTCLHVREDNLSLYGFFTREQRKLFLLLIGVSGIGPRGAMNMLAAMPPARLVEAIVSENTGILTKIPGIGVKTARRLVLELKDKLAGMMPSLTLESSGGATALLDAIDALKALGYHLPEIERLVHRGQQELEADWQAADMVNYVLKQIGRKG